ncbi:hypothetical protein ACOSP7_002790 [Xanthoceras sorbifolium]
MKKLYKKGKVHPSPPSATGGADHHHHYLALVQLPATILTLAAALSPQDKQVLAYLISCCGTTTTKTGSDSGSGDDHPPVFECNCFRCYLSFWARWDASPNRQLIHEIIEVYEEELMLFEENKKTTTTTKKKKKKKLKKREKREKRTCDHESRNVEKEELAELDSVEVSAQFEVDGHHHENDPEKGPVRKIVSFLGQKIWDFLCKKEN